MILDWSYLSDGMRTLQLGVWPFFFFFSSHWGRHSPIVQPWFRSRPGAEGPRAHLLPQRHESAPLEAEAESAVSTVGVKPTKDRCALDENRVRRLMCDHTKIFVIVGVRVNFQDPRLFFSIWYDASAWKRFSYWWKSCCVCTCARACVCVFQSERHRNNGTFPKPVAHIVNKHLIK